MKHARAIEEVYFYHAPAEATREELCWVAGLFEGEGTISIASSHHGKSTYLLVSVVSTDPDTLEPFQRLWPARTLREDRKRDNPRAKVAWVWRLSCRKAAGFLADVSPFFRTMRVRKKAALALQYQATRRLGDREWTPEYLAVGERFRSRMRVLNRRGAP